MGLINWDEKNLIFPFLNDIINIESTCFPLMSNGRFSFDFKCMFKFMVMSDK